MFIYTHAYVDIFFFNQYPISRIFPTFNFWYQWQFSNTRKIWGIQFFNVQSVSTDRDKKNIKQLYFSVIFQLIINVTYTIFSFLRLHTIKILRRDSATETGRQHNISRCPAHIQRPVGLCLRWGRGSLFMSILNVQMRILFLIDYSYMPFSANRWRGSIRGAETSPASC